MYIYIYIYILSLSHTHRHTHKHAETKPVSPAVAGWFFTTELPGKSPLRLLMTLFPLKF